MKCPYCESQDNDFVLVNQTSDYSGIEISINRQGMLRVRYSDDKYDIKTQDITEIKYCPLCGKSFIKSRR